MPSLNLTVALIAVGGFVLALPASAQNGTTNSGLTEALQIGAAHAVDLTGTTDGRSLEAAKMIYERLIEPALRNQP